MSTHAVRMRRRYSNSVRQVILRSLRDACSVIGATHFDARPRRAADASTTSSDFHRGSRGVLLALVFLMRSLSARVRFVASAVAVTLACVVVAAATTLGGALPGPLPLFPGNNWWNLDVSTWPVDPGSASFINFVGATRGLHPDFGGDVSPGSAEIYGSPYIVVDGTLTKRAVTFQYADESDGVNHTTGTSFPFYPIPDEAITQAHWVEGGEPGNVDLRSVADRHILIVDRDNRYLYELYNVYYDGTK